MEGPPPKRMSLLPEIRDSGEISLSCWLCGDCVFLHGWRSAEAEQKCHFRTPKVALLRSNCGTFAHLLRHFWAPTVGLLPPNGGQRVAKSSLFHPPAVCRTTFSAPDGEKTLHFSSLKKAWRNGGCRPCPTAPRRNTDTFWRAHHCGLQNTPGYYSYFIITNLPVSDAFRQRSLRALRFLSHLGLHHPQQEFGSQAIGNALIWQTAWLWP